MALLVFVSDHLSKAWIVANIQFTETFSILPGYFDIIHTRNTGAAFGFLHNWQHAQKDLFFYAIGILAFVLLLQFIRTTPVHDRLSLRALGGILGGALGNSIDRLYRGSVVDFISVHIQDKISTFTWGETTYRIAWVWPAFNIADSAIVLGVVFLLWRSLRPKTVS